MNLSYFKKRIFLIVWLLAIFCGCSTTQDNSAGSGGIATVIDNGAVQGGGEKGNLSPVIKPGMLLNVTVMVMGKSEVKEEECNVSQVGEVYLPLLKDVALAGMTVTEAEVKLTKLFSEYLKDPQVDVFFSGQGQKNFVSPWGYVTVMGNVVTPGRIALPQGRKLRLSEAVALAGGLAPSAKDREVRLTRRGSDGKLIKKEVNLRAITAHGKLDEDVKLLPGDIVFIPETIF